MKKTLITILALFAFIGVKAQSTPPMDSVNYSSHSYAATMTRRHYMDSLRNVDSIRRNVLLALKQNTATAGTVTSITPGWNFTSNTPITTAGTMQDDSLKVQTVANLFPKADARYSKLPTINVGITRPINGTAFTVSSTKVANVFYNITISCTATIGSASTGTVTLQALIAGTWTTLAEVTNSNTVTLAIVLNSVNVQTVVLSSAIPLGVQVRMNSTISGTTTITYLRGVESF